MNMSLIFSNIAANHLKVTRFYIDLRYFLASGASPTSKRLVIEPELAWKSISWFKLRFYL